jgi:hypothetical protein
MSVQVLTVPGGRRARGHGLKRRLYRIRGGACTQGPTFKLYSAEPLTARPTPGFGHPATSRPKRDAYAPHFWSGWIRKDSPLASSALSRRAALAGIILLARITTPVPNISKRHPDSSREAAEAHESALNQK